MEEIIRKFFRLINEKKFDELFELFDPEVEFSAPFNLKAKGLEMIKPFYLNFPERFPEHVDTLEDIFIKDDRAAVLIDFKGKTQEGNAVTYRVMDYFRIENGKIKSIDIFFDSYHVLNLIQGTDSEELTGVIP